MNLKLLALFILICCQTRAQKIEWAAALPYKGYPTIGISIITDANGNVIVSGEGDKKGVYSSYFTKFDGKGNKIFDQFDQGRSWVNAVVTDKEGNIYARVGISGPVHLYKFDANGVAQWSKPFNFRYEIVDKLDKKDNLVLTGLFWNDLKVDNVTFTSSPSPDNYYYATLKFNGNGQCVSGLQHVGGERAYKLTSKNELLAGGTNLSYAKLLGTGSSQQTYSSVGPAFFAKFDSVGTVEVLEKRCEDFDIDANDNVYRFVLGTPEDGRNKFRLAKYRPDGSLVWKGEELSFASDDINFYRFDVNEKGETFITHSFAQTYYVGSHKFESPYGKTHILKFDVNGSLAWQLETGQGGSYPMNIKVQGDDIFVTGLCGWETQFGTTSLKLAGMYVVKIKDDNSNLVGVQEQISKKKLEIFPNPSGSVFYIHGIGSAADLQVYDMTGKTVYIAEDFTNNNIDLSHLPRGAYMISIRTAETVETKKIILGQ